MREKISACLMTFNEERNIERALKSLQWCDEIVVLDSFSTDRTVELARAFTDRIYQHKWEGFIAQRNRVREMATHDWVLFLDADEEVTIELKVEIERELERNRGRHVGYRFPRMVFYLGKWIRHGEWYPDRTLRLFEKTRGHSVGVEPHDRVEVDGPVKNLRTPLLHYTHDNVWDHLVNINDFSSISAKAKFDSGIRFRFRDLFWRPHWRFFRGYFIKCGFRDGWAGYMIALMSMFEATVKYAKLWELELEAKSKKRSAPSVSAPDPQPPAASS